MAATASGSSCAIRPVSTHSHPKVAASDNKGDGGDQSGFNTQPPEGGCVNASLQQVSHTVSTHSHPKVAASDNILSQIIT